MKLLFLLPFVAVLAGCNQGSLTPLDPPISQNHAGSVAWTVPAVGTQFVFLDSGETEADTFRVTQTKQMLQGKSNVLEIFDVLDFDTLFYNYETNGDFSFGQIEENDTTGMEELEWQTYPTGSHDTVFLERTVDTTENEVNIFEGDFRFFAGLETITVPAGTFSTIHIEQLDFEAESESGQTTFDDTEKFDYWFAPSTGFYVKEMFMESEDGITQDSFDDRLVQLLK